MASAFVLFALLPAAALAEENCGSMMRTVARFHGTVRFVEPIGQRELEVTPIDWDMLFVASVDVERVDAESLALKAGETRNFGIHSPSRIFGSEDVVGTSVDLEAEWMACDGVFRRFVGLRTSPPRRIVEDFDGWIEVGHSYRAQTQREPDFGLSLVERLRLPMHHDGGVAWLNVDAFPKLTGDGAVRTIVFEVVAVHIDQMEKRRWLSIYDLQVVDAP